MGKTPKPLKIAFVNIEDDMTQVIVRELCAQGHQAEIVRYEGDFDLYLGPTCARFLPGMERFLDAFIKGARKVRYPGKEKDV